MNIAQLLQQKLLRATRLYIKASGLAMFDLIKTATYSTSDCPCFLVKVDKVIDIVSFCATAKRDKREFKGIRIAFIKLLVSR